MIRDQILVALDVETTGLRPLSGDRVIEIALVRGRRGEAPECWSSLLQPGRSIRSTEIHGITAEMLTNQPAFIDCLPQLERMMEGAVLVGHHASVDLGFLVMEYRKAGRTWTERPTLDTLGLARHLPTVAERSLLALSRDLNLPVLPIHRAEADALATWHLAWALVDRLDPEQQWTLAEALRFSGRRRSDLVEALLTELLRAQESGVDLWVEYRSSEATTIRRITVKKVGKREIEAYCHLRGADRKFRVDRLRVIEPA